MFLFFDITPTSEEIENTSASEHSQHLCEPSCIYLFSTGSVECAHYGCCHQQEFFQYYMESNGSRPSADEENKMDLLKKGTEQACTDIPVPVSKNEILLKWEMWTLFFYHHF